MVLGEFLATDPEAVADAEQVEGVARWSGVGVVMSWKAGRAGSAGWIWLRQMVARSASRLVKLCSGRLPSVRVSASW